MRRYYEFAIVVTLLGGLSLFLLEALSGARRNVEEALVQSEAAALRVGLVEVVAHREVYGGNFPSSNNPVDWVAVPPSNYQGVLERAPEARSVWYYDRPAGELVFRFNDGHRARFKLSRSGGSGGGTIVLGGIALVRLPDLQE